MWGPVAEKCMGVRHKWLSAGRVVCQDSRWAVLQKKDKHRKNWAKTHLPVFLKWCLKVILMMRKCQNSSWSGLPLQREYAPCQLANIWRQRIQSNVYNVKIELYRFMYKNRVLYNFTRNPQTVRLSGIQAENVSQWKLIVVKLLVICRIC